MSDLVFIEGLKAKAVIGVYDWEKIIQQDLLLDLEMEHDNRLPAATDDLSKTLDYEAISNYILAYCLEHQFELIETLAERLLTDLAATFQLQAVRLVLRKPAAVAAADAVGVKLYRRFAH
ncbi:dihydroneopterin aldolase [Marinomonas posidonica]|uniref:7,8-dihydroneopterin aldolase n=1 Tax=Marinomonas posidonica (strain CECT 7376 / NCIMB 14433 / IVIA-Po-181) TaxID=491952 RepID=F6D031_MARPP|nr:dihydroneopterin aldolase [Marinomonas posidonica]AEF55855.1 dihydroneopterin aldolase [Marinomonas posidonica IVIA-Po-181]